MLIRYLNQSFNNHLYCYTKIFVQLLFKLLEANLIFIYLLIKDIKYFYNPT